MVLSSQMRKVLERLLKDGPKSFYGSERATALALERRGLVQFREMPAFSGGRQYWITREGAAALQPPPVRPTGCAWCGHAKPAEKRFCCEDHEQRFIARFHSRKGRATT